VRATSAPIAGTFVTEGVVGLGTDSDIDVDVTGRELPDLQAMLDGRRRRSKPLLALARFLTEMEVGNDVGVFIERGRALLVGRLSGDYHFDPNAAHGLVHQRFVSWHSVVERADVVPPASLQDVRPVFRVRRKRSSATGGADGMSPTLKP
jgi:hypothetical protein